MLTEFCLLRQAVQSFRIGLFQQFRKRTGLTPSLYRSGVGPAFVPQHPLPVNSYISLERNTCREKKTFENSHNPVGNSEGFLLLVLSRGCSSRIALGFWIFVSACVRFGRLACSLAWFGTGNFRFFLRIIRCCFRLGYLPYAPVQFWCQGDNSTEPPRFPLVSAPGRSCLLLGFHPGLALRAQTGLIFIIILILSIIQAVIAFLIAHIREQKAFVG